MWFTRSHIGPLAALWGARGGSIYPGGDTMATTDRPDPQTHTALPHLLAEAKDRLIAEAQRRIRAEGFDGISGNGVVFRWLDPDGSRLADMVERSGMSKQAFGEHIASLEHHGYLVRLPDPSDGRAKLVVPTDRGRAAHALARRIFAELEAEWAEEVGEEAFASLRAALERIAGLGAGPPTV